MFGKRDDVPASTYQPAATTARRTNGSSGNGFSVIGADVVVIGVAFYNLTISSQLKAWIDRIVIAGKTFRYTENGFEGLANDKWVILTVARGGEYRQGTGLNSSEHAEAYLRSIFAFIGVHASSKIASRTPALVPK